MKLVTGALWSLAESPVKLITGEVWSPVYFWSPARSIVKLVIDALWSPARSPLKLVTGVVTGEVGHRCTLVAGVVTGEIWSPARSPVKFVTCEVWPPLKFGHRTSAGYAAGGRGEHALGGSPWPKLPPTNSSLLHYMPP